MKTKRSFVTNSSSTSFILSTTKNYEGSLKIKLEIEVDLCEVNGKKATNAEELWKWMEYYGFEKDSEIYEQALIELSRGKEIHFISPDRNHEDAAIRLIANYGITKYLINKNDIKVIMGD